MDYIKRIIKRAYKKLKKKPMPNPFKVMEVGNYLLKSNSEHSLDKYLKLFPNYSINFPRLLSWVITDEEKSELIIDVGANIGDTVALLRSFNIVNPILCVEGNPLYLPILKENLGQFTNVTIIETYLSDTEADLNWEIESVNGTAKLVESNIGKSVSSTSLDILMQTAIPNKVKVLKVDTDGFDIQILKGSKNLIIRDHPILFFEYDTKLNISTQSCSEFLFSLTELGYSKVLFYDNFGRLVISTDLNDKEIIYFIDKYIADGKGAFPYYDVAVFTKEYENLLKDVVKNEHAL
jgi:FkbM family methyltransferase